MNGDNGPSQEINNLWSADAYTSAGVPVVYRDGLAVVVQNGSHYGVLTQQGTEIWVHLYKLQDVTINDGQLTVHDGKTHIGRIWLGGAQP